MTSGGPDRRETSASQPRESLRCSSTPAFSVRPGAWGHIRQVVNQVRVGLIRPFDHRGSPRAHTEVDLPAPSGHDDAFATERPPSGVMALGVARHEPVDSTAPPAAITLMLLSRVVGLAWSATLVVLYPLHDGMPKSVAGDPLAPSQADGKPTRRTRSWKRGSERSGSRNWSTLSHTIRCLRSS